MTVASEPSLDVWLALGTSTVAEASGLSCALDPSIRPCLPGAKVVGPAYPVQCAPGNNLPIHRGLELADAGSVLVIDAGGDLAGYWGEVLTRAAMQRGLAGVVINGGMRDVDAIGSLGFPVFSAGVSMRGTGKSADGTVGEPLDLGGVPVVCGSLIVGDSDGVLALPAEAVEDTLIAARARDAKEREYFERIAAGETTVDIYGWRDRVNQW